MHSLVDRLLVDNMRILSLADHIQATLARPSTKIHLEELAFEIIDFNDRTLRMHIYRQDHAVFSVLREHGRDHSTILADAEANAASIEAQLLALRRAVELAEPLRRPLEETELVLRAYVDHNESAVLPIIKSDTAGPLQHEVERRLAELEEPAREGVEVRLFTDV